MLNKKILPIMSVHLEVDSCLLSETPIHTAEDAIQFVADKIYDSAKENAVAIFMDDTRSPLCVSFVGSGNTTNVMFSARDIVQTALLCNANYVIIMHNHPGFNTGKQKCKPSREDVLVTDAIIKACGIVGVEVYDSIVTSFYKKDAEDTPIPIYYSMKDKNYRRLKKKMGVKDEPLPSSEEELVWEKEDAYYTKQGEIPNQKDVSLDVQFQYIKNDKKIDFEIV